MNRRGFLLGLMTAGVAVAACAKPPGAEAAPLSPQTIDQAAKALAEAPTESAGGETTSQYYYRRRPRYWRRPRRYYYRPRRYYYRPRRYYYRRPVYYRPRFYMGF